MKGIEGGVDRGRRGIEGGSGVKGIEGGVDRGRSGSREEGD